MRRQDHEEWFLQFCDYLQTQTQVKAVQEITPSMVFPCIHVEYLPDENCFDRLTGALSINLIVIFEAHSHPYLKKIQEILAQPVELQKGTGLFKEIKVQKKSDKKTKNTTIELRYFVRI
jgi:hypothetical protein